ncbi:hypothetical protein [Actinoplanes sp. NBRC 101535]|uniref:hypothetical protein n=1 Tax=Actinoplanes sp. NBRC 101535 TaxID=3032196 RepID=UPI0024A35DE1|nr:hypothetical protein [Actinoplanes sp. NBRC 101535]GLY04547.1 hypothetical protein Acsp01_49260 [Actinoplanes sp. NBRC 101535]
MSDRVDQEFVARVRSGLDREIAGIVAETTADWTGMQHRRLAERVKTLVAAWRGDTGRTGLLDVALHLTGLLRGLQNPSGLFRGGDNVDSPPDSAFSVNDLADVALLLRVPQAAGHPLVAALDELLTTITPALVKGGVHTPNHRWEISAALARLHRLGPRPELAGRVAQWLAEGADIEDGLYSERSANYAAYVSNPSLLVIGEVFDRPDLIDAVVSNLDATLDLLLPDGAVETVLSRRQDQGRPKPLAGYLLPLRRIARLRGRGDLSWAAGLALEQGLEAPGHVAAALVLDPDLALALPAPVAPPGTRRRHFPAAGLLVDRTPVATTVVFGGSDYPRQRRIRSGLANSPTFLRLYAGAAVLDSVRLSRTFFGLGPFRGDGLTLDGDQAVLTERVSAAYYQPLDPAELRADADYGLGDDGRFSAAMDFAKRGRDEVTLETTVRVDLTGDGAELSVEVSGAIVDWALELAFRPGGTMHGARPVGAAWQLDEGTAHYRVGDDSIQISVTAADHAPADGPPAYHPGEEYAFLGGTDAASGEILYVTGKAPARLRLNLLSTSRTNS